MGLGKEARVRAELAGWGAPLRGAKQDQTRGSRLSQRSNSKVKIPARGQEKSWINGEATKVLNHSTWVSAMRMEPGARMVFASEP